MLVTLSLLGFVGGLFAGLTSGPLWLDETLSVEIARLPLAELPAALRQDGAPPVYYLLLHAWMAVFGTGTIAVRLLTVCLAPAAVVLVWVVGRRCAGLAGGRAAVVVLATLPWSMRFFSETRMYGLVVVLVLLGVLVLLRVRQAPGRGPVALLAVVVATLLLTHYWSLFLLAAIGLWHLPAAVRQLRGRTFGPEGRVVAGLVAGGVLFTPWLPTFVFQAAHTGAPWAVPPGIVTLLITPTFWGGGWLGWRWLLAAVLVPLVVLGARRRGAGRALAAVAGATLLLAWAQTATLGGAYTGRYTAVAVPLVCLAAALGAAALPGPRRPLLALALVATIGTASGVTAAASPRTTAAGAVAALRAAAAPGALVVACPDQLAPAVARLLGPTYQQVVYPTLGPPQRIDWVDYAARQAAADPVEVADRIDALAGDRPVLLLTASGYRTYGKQCDDLLTELSARRGPAVLRFGRSGTHSQLVYSLP